MFEDAGKNQSMNEMNEYENRCLKNLQKKVSCNNNKLSLRFWMPIRKMNFFV